MAFDLWLTFSLASLALLVLPGPTLLLVLSYALSQGRRVAVASALGVATGDLIAMTVSVIGLGAILLTSAFAFTIVKWIGAVYLMWLGLRMIRLSADQRIDTRAAKSETPTRVFRDLTLVTALNPKSNAFFLAFVPQFIDPAAAFTPQVTILIATFVGIAGVNALVFALAANSMRLWLNGDGVQTWIARGGGMALMGMGIATATLKRST